MRKMTWAAVMVTAIAGGVGGSVFAAGKAVPVVATIVESSFKGTDSAPHLSIVVLGSKLNTVKRVSLAKTLVIPVTEAQFMSADALSLRTPGLVVADFSAAVAAGTYDVYFNVPTTIASTDTFTASGKVVVTDDPVKGDPVYTAGTGLSLAAGAFSVNFAGGGTAGTAMRSDRSFDTSYVLKAGDTVTGPLTVTGALTANSATATSDNALIAKCSVATASTTSANNCAVFKNSAAANVARVSNTGAGFFNGGAFVTGADFAESVDVIGKKADFEAGDVIVIDTSAARRFALSAKSGSALVAGVYATKPGVVARPGDVAGDPTWADREIPLAMVGIVPTKVCDEGGAIHTGDLLVTSSLRGHAMKAPANPAPGTILGKALGEMNTTTGRIEILLQAR